MSVCVCLSVSLSLSVCRSVYFFFSYKNGLNEEMYPNSMQKFLFCVSDVSVLLASACSCHI